MNDRFRFRAKRLDNNKFVYGYLCFIYIDNEKHCKIYSPDDAMSYDCYTETLGQCTGLKDKNGKLIYEGDIVRESPYNKYFEYADYVISWKDGAYTNEKCLGMKNKETGEIKDCSKGGYCFSKHIHQELADDFEVIGNIHENADLIKVGGK